MANQQWTPASLIATKSVDKLAFMTFDIYLFVMIFVGL